MVRRGTTPLKRGLVAGALAASLALPGLIPAGTVSATPSRSDLASARARLDQLHHDFEVVVERYDTVRTRLQQIRKDMATTRVQIGDLRRGIATHQRRAVAVARRMYESGSSGALEMVLSSKNIGEIESNLQYLSSSESSQARVFEKLAVERKQLSLKLHELSAAQRRVAADEERLARLRSSIQHKMRSQRAEIARLEDAIRRAEQRRKARLRAERAAAAQADPAPTPTHSAPAPAPPAPAQVPGSPNAQVAVQTALAQVGKPYQWGAAGPNSFDCSGLTMYAWAAAGVSLPHSAAMQYGVTRHVSLSAIQPGDLLFYYSPISHVAMYVGGGRMVEAPHTGAYVQVVPMRTSDLTGVGRP